MFMMGIFATGGFTKQFTISGANHIKLAAIGDFGWTTAQKERSTMEFLTASYFECKYAELGEIFDGNHPDNAIQFRLCVKFAAFLMMSAS